MTNVAMVHKGGQFICVHPKLSSPKLGMVIALTSDPAKMIGLQFTDDVGGHSCDGRGVDRHCLWVRPEHIMTVEEHRAASRASAASESQDLEELRLRD